MAPAEAAVSFLKKNFWVAAVVVSLGALSVMVDPQEASSAVATDEPEDMILLQSNHRMTRTFGQIPGIVWSARDPYLDKDYPKDDQPGNPPKFTTEAPPPAIDTAPAPSKISATPAPAPPQKIVPPPPAGQGPPWKWSKRDPYLDHDYPKDDQPTGSPNLLQSIVVENDVQEPAEKTPEKPLDAEANGKDAKSSEEANETETKSGEEVKSAEVTKAEVPSAETNIANSSMNVTTEASNVSTTDTGSDENTTQCATRNDPRAVSWWLETAPVGTPCTFGVDVRDEGKHCVLDNEEYGTNGWCYTKADKSQWGSCNANCPLQGPHAKLGNMLDSVAENVQEISEKVPSSPDSSNNVSDASPVPEVPGSNQSTPDAPTGQKPNASTAPAVPATAAPGS